METTGRCEAPVGSASPNMQPTRRVSRLYGAGAGTCYGQNMAQKFSEPRDHPRRETRAESERRSAKLLAAQVMALAAITLLFDDEDDSDPPS